MSNELNLTRFLNENITNYNNGSADVNNVSMCPLMKSHMWFINYLYVIYVVNCVLHSIFAVIAVGENSIVLYSILKTPSLHKPSIILICNLAITDMMVGLLVQPLYVIYKVAEISGFVGLSCYMGVATNMLANMFSGISLLTVTLISLDRYLALHLHLRYPAIVTTERVIKLIVAVWVFTAFLVSFYPWKISISLIGGIAIVPICLIVSTFTFFKIYTIVRRHQRQVIDQQNAMLSVTQNPGSFHGLNLSKYWKSVITMGYVYILLVVCYLPYMFTLGIRLLIGVTKEYKLALNVTTSVIYINSSINPLIYCSRLSELRNAVYKVLGKPTSHKEISRTFHFIPRSRSHTVNSNLVMQLADWKPSYTGHGNGV